MENLRDACAAKHKIAENMPFNLKMAQGELSKTQYLMYLLQQQAIFTAIEKVGLPSPSLARQQAIEADIAELTTSGVVAGKVLPSTSAYVSYLIGLSYDEILPHIYVNYLALMYGGQFMKKHIPSSGKMYEFSDMPTAMRAVRNLQKDEWATEANKAYDAIIEIFKELEQRAN